MKYKIVHLVSLTNSEHNNENKPINSDRIAQECSLRGRGRGKGGTSSSLAAEQSGWRQCGGGGNAAIIKKVRNFLNTISFLCVCFYSVILAHKHGQKRRNKSTDSQENIKLGFNAIQNRPSLLEKTNPKCLCLQLVYIHGFLFVFLLCLCDKINDWRIFNTTLAVSWREKPSV